eukprot:216566-Chlamydomonas_euryale.AAC.1
MPPRRTASLPPHRPASLPPHRAICLRTGYLVCLLLGRHVLGGSLARGLRQCGMLVSGVYFLSPLLRSLART